ncbi:hypothetical protein [Microbacterium sp. A1-JK]|uniref:hypothetical protein n=1 Tax=Microbacterium sp. A1-JK TaxID=3177516 RepID=UPI003889EFB2
MTTVQKATPRVETLMNLEHKIADLRGEQKSILETIVQDAEFMDVPIYRLYYFDVDDDREVTPGTPCHLVWVEHEWSETMDRFRVHAASKCDGDDWCQKPGATVKFPKYCHVGSRTFYTRHTDVVCVGVEDVVEEMISGKSPKKVMTFVSVSTGRQAAA